jgi:hypothetical protein
MCLGSDVVFNVEQRSRNSTAKNMPENFRNDTEDIITDEVEFASHGLDVPGMSQEQIDEPQALKIILTHGEILIVRGLVCNLQVCTISVLVLVNYLI